MRFSVVPRLTRLLNDVRATSWAPTVALILVSCVSLGARAAWLDQPCDAPCATPADHLLIFDEVYYVNAARAMDGVAIPHFGKYRGTPPGVDPNSEHPQLAKMVIAGSIRLFGDGPLAWRLGSLLFGSLGLLGMYALTRAAGGSPWLAVGAGALMAADNLLLVHGRIGTLDIYVLAFMLWSAAAYLRGHRVTAGILLGVGACMKLVAVYLVLVFALVEMGRYFAAKRSEPGASHRIVRAVRGLLATGLTFVVSGFLLLTLLDKMVPPYVSETATVIQGPVAHLGRMLSFGAAQTSPNGPQGIASYPWQWLADFRPISYRNVDVTYVVNGQTQADSVAHFLGLINPALMLLVVPGLLLALRRCRSQPNDVDLIAVAWFAGTFLPFEALSFFLHRTSYLYYMVIVMPGCYLAAARLLSRPRAPRVLTGIWIGLFVVLAGLLYPFTVVPDLNWI